MEQPRFLVIGRNGQVGWELRRALAVLGEVVAVDYPQIDLTQPDSIRQHIRDNAPSVLINAAAHTAVDRAESEEALATQINGVAPGIMAEEARRLGALLVHYSTDYVYNGAKPTPYVETDAPAPLGAYGRSKLAGDAAVRAASGPHLIFRLCWVYGARGANFMLTMLRLARERDQLRVVDDQWGCPTWCRMIAEATAFATARWLRNPDERESLTGIYHLAAAGKTTWRGFAQAIVDSMPADGRKVTQVDPITTEQYPLPAKRPAFSVLDCSKLQKTFGLRLPDWRQSLEQVLEK